MPLIGISPLTLSLDIGNLVAQNPNRLYLDLYNVTVLQ